MRRFSHLARHANSVHRIHRRRNQLKAIRKMQHKRRHIFFLIENHE